MFYIFSQQTASRIDHVVSQHIETIGATPLSCGKLVEMLVMTNDTQNIEEPFYGMRLPSAFGIMNCASKLATFRDFERLFQQENVQGQPTSFDSINSVTVRSYARCGLMGNPSDGMYGKTLGVTVSNFWAEVHLSASDRIVLHPHPLYDPSESSSNEPSSVT